jgi:hypothetical protein
VVAVDPDTGGVEILDYVVVEDGGTLVNPTIVSGYLSGHGEGWSATKLCATRCSGPTTYSAMPKDVAGKVFGVRRWFRSGRSRCGRSLCR